jgi:prepilin signal peptidase PulO-like enzyme (type II secretory pathway)
MTALTVLTAMAAAALGMLLARRFDGVSLPIWAGALAMALVGAVTLGFGPPQGAQVGPQLGPLLGLHTDPQLAWSVVLITLLTALALIDAATHRLPDILSLALIALGLAQTAITGDPVWLRLIAAVLLVAMGLLTDRLFPDSPVGAGDFLLLAGVLCWLGFAPLLELAMLTAALLWVHWLILLVVHRGRAGGAPLAPALALSCYALWLA